MPSIRPVLAPLPSAVLCFVLSAAMIKYLSFQGNLASAWPGNAVILAQLLARPRREWGRYLFAAFIAIAAAGAFTRGTLSAPVGLAVANVLEIALAAWLLRGTVDADGRLLHHHASVGRFAVCTGIVAPGFGALLGSVMASFAFDLPVGISLATKFSADALGLMIFTPFFFGLFHGDYRAIIRAAARAERLQMLLLLGAVLAVSLAVFGQNRYPLLFLPMVPLMLVAFRLGWEGTSLGVMLVAVTGGVATFYGHGPVSLSAGDMALKLAFLQFYLATVLLLMMPVAAALAARRDLIERLSESERSLGLLADRSAIVLLRFSAEGACTRVVGDVKTLVGEQADRLLGAHVGELDPPLGEALFGAHLRADTSERPVMIEVERPGGVWIEATFRAERDEHGIMTGSVATLVDVTARKAREGELSRRAETDELTGLSNRAGFLRRFEAALADPPADGLSIALIDVDRFKSLNDELGHVAGDAALAEIGRRIAVNLRATDLVARLGGDEFVVMLGTADAEVAQEICRRMVESVSAAPVALPLGGEAAARISCGLVHRTPGQGGIDLLNRADMALYAAKRGGRNQLIAA
ncbi:MULTISPECIES: sensor domain-containing diguanylate cyclase [unclassified Novosphingobium]|uniref:sensor domain-containing diguanylate cyclase n=1 Tax=unclassified Novosphingobium TaxID=2644732 RepID=UPI002107904D|nr:MULTISPECIES: sensor domain-containing diguanylate cyclase [unclassified Novosphingobium]